MITTPIEKYKVNGIEVLVKREDLASSDEKDSPPFSKIRGLLLHLIELKKKGITTVGYTETSISMAGWGVAWAANKLDMNAVIFDPQYKETPQLLKFHRKQWKKFSPCIIPIKAGMAKVNYYISRGILSENYSNSVMLPLGLPLEESIQATAKEFTKTYLETKPNSIVISVGSGTIASGVYFDTPNHTSLYGIMTRTGSTEIKKQSILTKSKKLCGGFFGENNLHIIDMEWDYTEECIFPCPFPCHSYYDRKAWKWLVENINYLKPPILFWNIGH